MAERVGIPILPDILMRLYCAFRRDDLWHNRRYPSELHMTENGGHIALRRGSNTCTAAPISALWNRFEGRRAHVVASGPSISLIRQPARMLEQFTMAVNGSLRLFADPGSRIDAYLVDDPHFARTHTSELVANARRAKLVFLSYQAVAEVLKRQSLEDIDVVLFDNARRPFRMPRQHGPIATREDLAGGVVTSDTVVLVALQILACLGFKDIAIFGMDLSAAGRFYSERNNRPQYLDRNFTEGIVEPFRRYAGDLRRRGVVVINCSLQSRLEETIFPRKDANAYLDAISALP
jgi:hypothetical protein